MWFAYVDESFNDSQHWVVALLIHHLKINETQRALRQLSAETADAYDLVPGVELHGHEIFHAEGAWEPMKAQVRARIGIYAHVFEHLVSAGCRIIFRGVSKPGLERRYGGGMHPHRVTMTHLLERVDEFAQARNDHALIVADEHHETQSALLRDLVTYQERGTWGYRGGTPLERVVDTIHFVNSATNTLVQGCDLVAFLGLRTLTHEETDPRAVAANEHLWSKIEPRISHQWCWYP